MDSTKTESVFFSPSESLSTPTEPEDGRTPMQIRVVPPFPNAGLDVQVEPLKMEPIPRAKQTGTPLPSQTWRYSDYGDTHLSYMLMTQSKTLPLPGFMSRQPKITWSDRTRLVSWVIDTMSLHNSKQETLYLTVNIMDRALSVRVFTLEKFQLVAIAAMWIAWKYEETRLPAVWNAKRMRHISGNLFVEKDIATMEETLLNLIHFDLSAPSPEAFLQYHVVELQNDVQDAGMVPFVLNLARFYAEVALLNHNFVGMVPSLVAEASLHMAMVSLGMESYMVRSLVLSVSLFNRHLTIGHINVPGIYADCTDRGKYVARCSSRRSSHCASQV